MSIQYNCFFFTCELDLTLTDLVNVECENGRTYYNANAAKQVTKWYQLRRPKGGESGRLAGDAVVPVRNRVWQERRCR